MAKRRTTMNEKRAKRRAESRAAKEHAMANPGGVSNYARKKKWLRKNGRAGYDAEVLAKNPKPWNEEK